VRGCGGSEGAGEREEGWRERSRGKRRSGLKGGKTLTANENSDRFGTSALCTSSSRGRVLLVFGALAQQFLNAFGLANRLCDRVCNSQTALPALEVVGRVEL